MSDVVIGTNGAASSLSVGAILLIALGLFFVGGVIAFFRQGLRVFAGVLALAAALALAAGVLRL